MNLKKNITDNIQQVIQNSGLSQDQIYRELRKMYLKIYDEFNKKQVDLYYEFNKNVHDNNSVDEQILLNYNCKHEELKKQYSPYFEVYEDFMRNHEVVNA